MTSNVGSTFISELAGKNEELMRKHVMDALRGQFRPEFLNRVDEIVIFHGLVEKQLETIVELETKALAKRLAERKIILELTPAAKALIAKEGYDPAYGARPIRRTIQRLILDPLAQKVLSGEYKEGDTVFVDAENGSVQFWTEEFADTKPRHAFRVRFEARADRAGRIRLFEARIDVDNGAYNHFGPSVMHVGVKTLGSIYMPDGAAWDARLVDTALTPGGQFRGYGSPQTTFAQESAVDELAEKAGIDPLEFRLRNANKPGTTVLCGARLVTARLDDCLVAVRDAIGWDQKKTSKKKDRGVGVAAAMHGSGSYAIPGSNTSMAAIDLYADGHARVRFGGADAGTGQRTILAQIAAEELGLSYDRVDVLSIDSERTPI
jgi:hypothetical protein